MNVNCENCRESYSLDVAMFKGIRGVMVRCHKCRKSFRVLNPDKIAWDRYVLDGVASEGDHSGNGCTKPAVSPAKEEYYPPLELEVEQVPPVEEQARIPRREWKEGEFSVAEPGKKFPPGSVQTCESVIILSLIHI